jgi:hypothetical protein
MNNFIKTQLSDRRRERFKDVAAVLLILAFFLGFFWRAIFGGEFFLIHDSMLYSYPLRKVAWEMIRHGQLPLWTPLIFSGYPLLSMAQLALGYPLTWLYLILPGHWAEQIYVFAPYVFAPAFTYAYARELGRSRTASLLAGLSFGYGGMMLSWISNGMMTNAVMWLPLALIAILRAQTRGFLPCVLGMTGAYALSVLSGTGQGFVYVGILALAYATLLGLSWSAPESGEENILRRWLNWRRWKPLAVVVCGIGLSIGVAAFQIFESWQAVRLSIREKLSYEVFSQLSFTRAEAWRSFLVPLYHYVDTMAYVPPLVALLALIAIFAAIRPGGRDVTVFFWLAVAVIASLLMLGPGTPLHGLAHRIPIVNSFRAPSRHSFELTFALSVLAAYGWDIVCRKAPFKSPWPFFTRAFIGRSGIVLVGMMLCLCAAIGVCWLLSIDKPSSSGFFDLNRAESTYLSWKLAFTLAAFTGYGLSFFIAQAQWRAGLLLALVALVAFVEPYILYSRWGGHIALPASRITSISPASRFLQAQAPEQNRIYTRVSLFTAQFPALDGQNLSALAGLQNVAGYEPLILKRYSRALGNVWLDGVTPLPGAEPNLTLLDARSRVLDLLNVRYLVTFPNLGSEYPLSIEKEGITFDNPGLGYAASSDERITLGAVDAMGDTLALVTSLSNSAQTPEGTPVARVVIRASDGRMIERELLAGRDSSELTQSNREPRPPAQRSMAPIFDQRAGDAANTFTVTRYWSRISLGERVKVDNVEITRLIKDVPLTLWMGTIYDSQTGRSTPLVTASRLQAVKGFDRWRPVYNQDNAAIFYNEKSLPRVWLTPKAERVDENEALRRIRGESERPFDPRQTALLEIEPGTAPTLPGNADAPNARAQVVSYEPARLVIETRAERSSVLVVSEINYPGWKAQVDGVKTPIYQTDYLLRGVILPAGAHRVEMNYAPLTARVGGAISLGTLALILGLAVYARRTRYRKEKFGHE